MSPIIWIIIIVVVAAICLLIGYILRKTLARRLLEAQNKKLRI